MNVVDKWERKAIACIKRSGTVKSRSLRDKYYQKAITYCDCIHNFTYDKDMFDCFDRLSEKVER